MRGETSLEAAKAAMFRIYREAEAVALQSTVPLLVHGAKGLGLAGSGTLVAIGAEHFIVTAAHVTDRSDADGVNPLPLAVMGPSKQAAIELAEVPIYFVDPPFRRLTSHAARTEPRLPRDDDPVDVSVLHLRDHQAERLKHGFTFIRQLQLGTVSSDPEAMFAVCGCPEESLSEGPSGVRAHLHAQLSVMFADQPTEESGFRLVYDHRASLKCEDGTEAPTPKPAGLSGGGVWQLWSTAPHPDRWGGEHLRLVGVEHAYHPGPGYVACTRIEVALGLIRRFVPNVGRALDLVTDLSSVPKVSGVRAVLPRPRSP